MVRLVKVKPHIERFPEYEELDWIASHAIGVDQTSDAMRFSQVLAQAAVIRGYESYYYMRYDDSPERNYIPMIYYVVIGNPKINVLLREEIEPVGHLFNVIAVFSSNYLIQRTSQRALLFDGAKTNATLVVNTSLSPDAVISLVKKYSLAQDWNGKVVTISSSKIDKSIAFPMIGATLRGYEKIDLDAVLTALDMLGLEKKKDSVRKGYEQAVVKEVNIRAEETEKFKTMKHEIEIPEFDGKYWNPEVYYAYQKAAATAENYAQRIAAMPRWEVLAPGLIEFGPKPGDRNIGFTTGEWRFQRPVINYKKCIDCKLCHLYCPDGAIDFNPIKIDYRFCTGCGVCVTVCPTKAIEMMQEIQAMEGLIDEEVPVKRFEERAYGY